MITPNPHEPTEPLEDEFREREGRGLLPDFVKKVAVAGLGALFMTEEGIRGLASQLKLPKEALSFVLSQAEKTKDEVGRVVSEEVRRFLQSDKVRDELLKMLTGMTMEIKAEVRLVPSSDSTRPLATKVNVTEVSAQRSPRAKKE